MNISTAYNIGSDIAADMLANTSAQDIIADMDTLDSLKEYFGECFDNYIPHTPFEFDAKEFGVWDAFEAGFYETIDKSLDNADFIFTVFDPDTL